MAAWATAIGPPMQQTSKALNEVAAGLKDGSIGGSSPACSDLDTAQLAVRDHLPAPDAALNAKMGAFVDDIHAAATKCAGYGPGSSDAELDEMMADIDKAGQDSKDALADIAAAMGGKP